MISTQQALLACLPPLAYDRQGARVQAEAAAAAAVIDGAVTSADFVRAEHQPEQTGIALTDWERNYGLPDSCGGASDSIDERRAALLGRILVRGNLSEKFIIDVAGAMGLATTAITIDEVGLFIWRVGGLSIGTVRSFRVGKSKAGDRLRSWGDEYAECRINKLKPAHTKVVFGYA